MNIWLSYVSYPVTTAVYLERALRQRCHVTTIGPSFPPQLISEWNLQNLRLPYTNHDIATDFNPRMEEILTSVSSANKPDLYLWVESVGGHFPEQIEALPCPKACYLIDTHLNLSWHLLWAERFDFIFLAQREYVSLFREKGLNAHWLPLACDPEIHTPHGTPLLHDISFVGSLVHNPRRKKLLQQLDEELGIYCERCFWNDMAKVFSASRMTFNNAVKNDLNMRVFEALSTGTLLLTDPAPQSGLTELFYDGEDLAIYQTDDELLEVARFYLANDLLRQQVAERGRKIVLNAHTYDHRVQDLLAVALHGKDGTASAEELRNRSLSGLSAPFASYRNQAINSSTQSNSFVIPVLDYSPASPYNIKTLLTDLEQIPGDVIVIFNSETLANDLKNHHRITRYAIMKENIGVARAWNTGIELATTPNVFILNADLHLRAEAIQVMEDGLNRLERAACVGPQGSFVNYRLTKDFLYFDKGSFDASIAVDAVSGFLFAVKREHFGPGGLKFEDAYTPCYFEEWDLGLQIKQMGLLSWVVPTRAYEHHWGGSIGARREIACLGRNGTAQEILQRNRVLFLAKWRLDGKLPESGAIDYLISAALLQSTQGTLQELAPLAELLIRHMPDRPEPLVIAGYCAALRGEALSASSMLRKAHQIDQHCAHKLTISLEHLQHGHGPETRK